MTWSLEGTGPFAGVIEAMESARSMTELELLLVQTQRHFGFANHFLSFQPVNDANRVTLTDLPAQGEFCPGPIEIVAARRIRPFFWDCSKHRPQPRRAGSPIFVIPMHIPGIATGFVCWLSSGRDFPREALADGQYIAAGLFEQVHRLNARLTRRPGRLSRRQLDCLRLAARGKSDWVASQILGLQPDTVHKYLEQAKNRYNVSTRTELVVRALYDGELHFGDLID